jgi:hypothetical protein
LLAQAGDQVLKLPAGQTGSGKDADVFRHVFSLLRLDFDRQPIEVKAERQQSHFRL